MEFTRKTFRANGKHTEKENGLQDLMEIMLESLMVSERREYLREERHSGNKGNGYRSGRTYGRGRTLTFRTLRDRYPSLRGYWPSCSTRRKNAIVLRERFTPKA